MEEPMKRPTTTSVALKTKTSPEARPKASAARSWLANMASPPIYMAIIGVVIVAILAAMTGKRLPEDQTFFGRIGGQWDSSLRFLGLRQPTRAERMRMLAEEARHNFEESWDYAKCAMDGCVEYAKDGACLTWAFAKDEAVYLKCMAKNPKETAKNTAKAAKARVTSFSEAINEKIDQGLKAVGLRKQPPPLTASQKVAQKWEEVKDKGSEVLDKILATGKAVEMKGEKAFENVKQRFEHILP